MMWEDEEEPSTSKNSEESLFQGENQLYPSRKNAANISHHKQNEREEDMAAQGQLYSEMPPANIKKGNSAEAALLVRPFEDNAEPATTSNSKMSTDKLVALSPSKAVNILPVNRNLIITSTNNLIAIGRKPQNYAVSSTLSNKKKICQSQFDPSSQSTLGWQAEKKNLRERIAHMYCNETLADVYFVVGNDQCKQTIPAHKFVLSIGSVVFDAMFNGGLTPRNTDTPLEIELPDVEPSAFLTLLKFLYSDEVSIGPESVMTTLYTAKKYAVPAMETACVEFLKQSLEADNAFMLLSQAKLFEEPQLEQLCLDLIDKNTLEAINADGFTDIDLATLCDVLNRNSLRVREIHLFQAVVRWAKAECERRNVPCTAENKRVVLGNALQLIRFPLMKIDEFALHVEPESLLSDREMTQIFKYLAVNPSDRPELVYSDTPRCYMSSTEKVVSRFQRHENRWGYCGTPDRIKFTVDRSIFVIGLGLYGSIHGPHQYKVQIKLIHCGTGKTLTEHDTSFVCDGTPTPCRVLFKEPVEILPAVTYIASACVMGPDTYYGTKGLRRIVHTEADVTFQFTYAAVNNNGTSVEDGQIPEIVFYTAQK
ncbi:unnamed protein product [Caenorhabditis bovis]|nr:unnamed protein product [Caenorhabditis bovis]